MATSQSEKAARFRALHEAPGAFVIPNPWDAGSARVLAGLGFEALATSSGASAGVLGRRDGHSCEQVPQTRRIGLSRKRAVAANDGLVGKIPREVQAAEDRPGRSQRFVRQHAEGCTSGQCLQNLGHSRVRPRVVQQAPVINGQESCHRV